MQSFAVHLNRCVQLHWQAVPLQPFNSPSTCSIRLQDTRRLGLWHAKCPNEEGFAAEWPAWLGFGAKSLPGPARLAC